MNGITEDPSSKNTIDVSQNESGMLLNVSNIQDPQNLKEIDEQIRNRGVLNLAQKIEEVEEEDQVFKVKHPSVHKKYQNFVKFNRNLYLYTNADKIDKVYDTLQVIDTSLLLLIVAFFVMIVTYVSNKTNPRFLIDQKEYQHKLVDTFREKIILYGLFFNVILSSKSKIQEIWRSSQ